MNILPLFERSGPTLRVDDVHKSYRRGGQTFGALAGITCDVAPGQLTVLMGPSGCGKTTLLNILGGVDRADTGRIWVGGAEITRHSDDLQLSRHRLTEVGFVFQAFNLIPGLTAIDNLQLPMAARGVSKASRTERARALLDLVGLRSKQDKRPDQLSGGEQQRVAIGLALANDAPTILADEPTGSLDSENGRRVTELLRDLAVRVGKTVLVATHDEMVAALGHRRLTMRDGRLL